MTGFYPKIEMGKLRVYHCSKDLMQVGDLLNSDWDSLIKQMLSGRYIPRSRHDQARIKVEKFFNDYLVTHKLAAGLPSRGNCIFTCWKYEHLTQWTGPDRPFCYELEMVDVKKYFATDAYWFNIVLIELENNRRYPYAEEYARRYWSGFRVLDLSDLETDDPQPHYELLIEGTLKVSRVIENESP